MRRKKKKMIWIIPVVIVVIALGIVGIFAQHFLMSSGTKTTVSTSLANNPVKTEQSNGYIASSSTAVASGSMNVVADVGAPQWVKVPSSTNLARFTDLSKGDLTIYRINNPEVLKTASSLMAPRTLMNDEIAKYPNTLIMNASAFDMNNGKIVGFQINNGQLLQDWNATGMQYTFVINKDGSCKIYDSSTPASTIIQNGAAQSYDFGTALIRDGKVVPSDGSVNWEIHTFIGNDKDNNLYVIISATNAGYENIMNGVSSFNLENLLELDSGGSSQLSVNGKVVVPSQDNRAVPDYIIMK